MTTECCYLAGDAVEAQSLLDEATRGAAGGLVAATVLLVVCAGAFGVSQWQRLTLRERAALRVMAEFRLKKTRKAAVRLGYGAWSRVSSWLFPSSSSA